MSQGKAGKVTIQFKIDFEISRFGEYICIAMTEVGKNNQYKNMNVLIHEFLYFSH